MKVISKERNRQDLAVYLFLFLLGAFEFALSCRAPDFVGDAYYYEVAKSIVNGTGYGFNFKPQTMLPPGFPLLLSLLIYTVGPAYTILVRSMAVFTTLGLIATYEVLRSRADRVSAAVTCLLLGSSPLLFEFSTTLVFSDMPYFCTSMIFLWLLPRVDSNMSPRWTQVAWWLLCGTLLLVSILMRSTGIALIGGMLGWLAVSLFSKHKAAKRRLKILIPLVIAGVATQTAWMSWAAEHQVFEWPLHGYQENYLGQLKLKNGNDPELGLATWKDVLRRPVDNAGDIATAMVGLYSRKQASPAWYSPMTVIPIFLMVLGLGCSFRKTGGALLEWYFVSYEAMFLFWPWDFELRFALPVAPLAFFYMWRGAIRLWRLAQDKPRRVGLFGLAVAVAGSLSSVAWGWGVPKPQMWWCVALWLIAAVIAIILSWGRKDLVRYFSLLLETQLTIRGRLVPLRQALGYGTITCLFAAGIVMQLGIGLNNLHQLPESDPDIQAAQWIKAHSAPSTVIMARKEDLVYHYSQRRVIWFPPSSDARLLMEGIKKYHIQQVVVVDRENSYWKPSDADSFRALSEAYPNTFIPIYKGPHSKVFAVSS